MTILAELVQPPCIVNIRPKDLSDEFSLAVILANVITLNVSYGSDKVTRISGWHSRCHRCAGVQGFGSAILAIVSDGISV